jgi:oligopeptide transport system ATP-binding protein
MENKNEVLLSVSHLKQYFKLGNSKLKAVHDVSFDVHKGEVFGIVGESGCGKTTIGRSIIKLYKITSGNIYFKGQRISAGTRWNEKEIKFTRIRADRKITRIRADLQEQITYLTKERNSIVSDFELKNSDFKTKINKRYDEKIGELKADQKDQIARLIDDRNNDIQSYILKNLHDELFITENTDKVTKKYDEEIGRLKAKGKERIADLIATRDVEIQDNILKNSPDESKAAEFKNKVTGEYNTQIQKLKNQAKIDIQVQRSKVEKVIAEQTEIIKSARHDNKNYNKDFIANQVNKVNVQYEEKIAKLSDNQGEEKQQLVKERDEKIKLVKNEKLMSKMQMVFQDPIASLNPRMTVKEIIAEGLQIQGIKDPKEISKRVYEALELVGLVPEHATRYPHEFSGGQRQRIGIARALIMNPDLIIADEPISALDVSIQAQVINLLNNLKNQFNLTILFIAHDLSVVKYFCDRICVMYFGKMVELAPSDELFKNPLHPYTKSLLSAIPVPDPYFEKQRKRITYNSILEHDYTVDKPTLREIKEGHFIYCNDIEFEKYKKELK